MAQFVFYAIYASATAPGLYRPSHVMSSAEREIQLPDPQTSAFLASGEGPSLRGASNQLV